MKKPNRDSRGIRPTHALVLFVVGVGLGTLAHGYPLAVTLIVAAIGVAIIWREWVERK